MKGVSKIKSKSSRPKTAAAKKERYFEAVGRRKTSVARVRLYSHREAKDEISNLVINDRPLADYFPLKKHRDIVLSPLEALSLKECHATVRVNGGGQNGQAEAVRLGISRALVLMDPSGRPKLKALDYLKRDPRMVERKKFGSRKARRPQQWRKR